MRRRSHVDASGSGDWRRMTSLLAVLALVLGAASLVALPSALALATTRCRDPFPRR